MPIRKSLIPLLRLAERLPSNDQLSVAERRAKEAASPLQMRTVMRKVRGRLTITDHEIPVGDRVVAVRVYRPEGPATAPGHVHIHGGAFWLGSAPEDDPISRWYAVKAQCIVVSVDYRLAPETTYPGPVEDCYEALTWVHANAPMLGIDPEALSIGGISAGGALAAATALMARDQGGPSLRFQLLEIPVTDLTLSQPSVDEFATGFLLTKDALREGYGFYAPDPARHREPYASPLHAPDLTGLPPAFVLTAECDPLRDEGEAYGRRLEAAGVPTEMLRVEGHVHGSNYLTRFMPSARASLGATTAALARAVHNRPVIGH